MIIIIKILKKISDYLKQNYEIFKEVKIISIKYKGQRNKINILLEN